MTDIKNDAISFDLYDSDFVWTSEYCSLRHDDNVRRVEVSVDWQKVIPLVQKLKACEKEALDDGYHGLRFSANIFWLVGINFFDDDEQQIDAQYHRLASAYLYSDGTVYVRTESKYCVEDVAEFSVYVPSQYAID